MDDYDLGDWDWDYTDPVTEIENTALPGDEAYGWKYYSDGTAISPGGEYYYQGEEVWSPSGGGVLDKLGAGVSSALKAAFTDDKGNIDWRSVAGAAGGLYGLYQANKGQEKTGYQGKIPTYEVQRTQVTQPTDPDRRPGEYGRRYFSDVVFASPTTPAAPTQPPAEQPADQSTGLAAGGLAGLAKGKYLRGQTDGMADKIPARIGGKQEAALSHGEFVIPADVVSHLGNGNSDAGAQRLYEMMDRIRKARTGTAKQGKQVNPNKFMPS